MSSSPLSSSPAADAASDASASAPPVIDDPEVQQLLAQHAFLEPITTAGGHVRVRCELTQHELLPRAAAIEQHLRSKKFVKAKEWYFHDYSQYAPYIVAHRRKPKSLFCNVTGMVLNRIPAEVERHVAGKKFQRLKEHVKITTHADGDDAESGAANDFDANAFEFENAQVLLSDDEEDEDEGGGGARKSRAKAQSDDDGDGDDDDDEEEDSDAEEKADEDEDEGGDDSDMAEFYPDEDDEDGDDGRLDHETVVKLAAQKKRKALESAAGAEKQPPAKKPKAAAAAPRPVSKARLSSKDRRQQKKAAYKK